MGINQVEPEPVAINIVDFHGPEHELEEKTPPSQRRSSMPDPGTTSQRLRGSQRNSAKGRVIKFTPSTEGAVSSETMDDTNEDSPTQSSEKTEDEYVKKIPIIRRERLKSSDGPRLRAYGPSRHAFSEPQLQRSQTLSKWSLKDPKSSLGERRKSFMIHYTMNSQAEIPPWNLLDRFRRQVWSKFTPYRMKVRAYLAEFLGTLVLVAFGTAVVAQVFVSDNMVGGHLSVSIGWGLAVMIGGYIAGGVSGAHLNPAVSFSLALYNRHPFIKVPGYMIAQLLGAFCGSLISYSNYSATILEYAAKHNMTQHDLRIAQVFTTFPADEVSQMGAFLNEFIASALLFIGILAVNDVQNLVPGSNMGPLIIGLTVTLVALSFGNLTGFSVNPARDIGPRFAMALAGFGISVFSGSNYYWWIPPTASFAGMIFGGALYFTFVSCEMDDKDDSDDAEDVHVH